MIELSKNEGNPLGPYIKENYEETINNNLLALSKILPRLPEMNRIKNEYIKKKEEKEISLEER